MVRAINILHGVWFLLFGVGTAAVNMQKVEIQWMKAIKLSQQRSYAKAVDIFKSISWEIEEFAFTLETSSADQIEAAHSVIVDIALAYSQTSKLLGLQLRKAGDITGAIDAFKTAVACSRAMLNQRRLHKLYNQCVAVLDKWVCVFALCVWCTYNSFTPNRV